MFFFEELIWFRVNHALLTAVGKGTPRSTSFDRPPHFAPLKSDRAGDNPVVKKESAYVGEFLVLLTDPKERRWLCR